LVEDDGSPSVLDVPILTGGYLEFENLMSPVSG